MRHPHLLLWWLSRPAYHRAVEAQRVVTPEPQPLEPEDVAWLQAHLALTRVTEATIYDNAGNVIYRGTFP